MKIFMLQLVHSLSGSQPLFNSISRTLTKLHFNSLNRLPQLAPPLELSQVLLRPKYYIFELPGRKLFVHFKRKSKAARS